MLRGKDRDDAPQVHILVDVRPHVSKILLFRGSHGIVREKDEEFITGQRSERVMEVDPGAHSVAGR